MQLRPFAAAAVEKDFSGDERTIRFAQTSAPTIVNSFALEDASKKAYGRFSGGFSAAILTNVSLDVAGSATIGKDQGEETSAHVGRAHRLLRSAVQAFGQDPAGLAARWNDQRWIAADRYFHRARPRKGLGDIAGDIIR